MTGHKGFFYHFLNNEDGTRRGKTELSTVDTALLLGGVPGVQHAEASFADKTATVRGTAAVADLIDNRRQGCDRG